MAVILLFANKRSLERFRICSLCQLLFRAIALDGMGLCLYLALMKHTLGEKCTFAVLDGILMSVDTSHCREVCRLLKTKFPDTQFVLTTHDRIWLQYMKTEGLTKGGQLFGGWNVETGPRIWDDTDIWTEIEAAFDKDDVQRRCCAVTLNILPLFWPITCAHQSSIVAMPIMDLGDLLPSVLSRWRNRLDKGIKSAAH